MEDLLYNGFLKIRAVEHKGKTYEVMDRGNSVNVKLVYMGKKKKSDWHFLGIQYRAGAGTPIFTNVAGMIDINETPMEAAIRETLEESGFVIEEKHLYNLGEYYNSPGGSSEMTYMFVAVVNDADRVAPTDIEEGVFFDEHRIEEYFQFSSMPAQFSHNMYLKKRKEIKAVMKVRGVYSE